MVVGWSWRRRLVFLASENEGLLLFHTDLRHRAWCITRVPECINPKTWRGVAKFPNLLNSGPQSLALTFGLYETPTLAN